MSSIATSRRFLAAPDRITLFCAIPVGLLGLMVIAGWMLRLPLLIQILPGSSPMMFNTAVGLILGAASLLGLVEAIDDHSVCGVLLLVLGGLTLAEYVAARDLGIDQLLFRDWHGGDRPAAWASTLRDVSLRWGSPPHSDRPAPARAAFWCCRPPSSC